MLPAQADRLRSFEGHRVSVALTGGARIDDCQLVSVGRHKRGCVWLFTNGCDTFVALSRILDVWES